MLVVDRIGDLHRSDMGDGITGILDLGIRHGFDPDVVLAVPAAGFHDSLLLFRKQPFPVAPSKRERHWRERILPMRSRLHRRWRELRGGPWPARGASKLPCLRVGLRWWRSRRSP